MPNIQDEFSIRQYVAELIVEENDEDYQNIMKHAEIIQIMYPNAYLARAAFYGQATTMENQMKFIGGNMIPNKRKKLASLNNRSSFMREDDLREYKFANEQQPHINEERSVDDICADIEAQIDEFEYSLRVAAIAFVVAVREHDAISNLQDQLTYSAIRAKAEEAKQGRMKSNTPNVKRIQEQI